MLAGMMRMSDVNATEYKAVENKLLLLYLIEKMDLPLSRSQITDYVRQAEYMDYFTLQQALAEMVKDGYLENIQDNNNTRYTITGEGQSTLEYFAKHIPTPIRAKINSYVRDNRRIIKRDYEITATYFPNTENNEFMVKCGVYEDERVLMELFISVDTREQAKLIQTNWKTNAKVLYGRIIEALVVEQPPAVPE
jgi:DNA-binding PadR family transcriptional regulator